MLVDDDADVRALTGEMLRELGHRPLIFADGAAALGALDGGIAADLLLTDFAMPGINGRELIERIAALHPAIPAILMTGHADVDLSNFAKGRVLRKPFVMSALARVLEEFSAPFREG
jgi:CheY-like chemotaxis protein